MAPRLPLTTLGIAVLASLVAGGAQGQTPAPYPLISAVDGELTSTYSMGPRSTTVQLTLVPSSSGGSASVTMVFVATFAGREPAVPPTSLQVVAVPVATANPNVIRGGQMDLTVEGEGSPAVNLSYFASSLGDLGFVLAGGEITRVAFTMSPAELRAIGAAERVTGHVMNYPFSFSAEQLAALRRFARAIGVSRERPGTR